MCVDSTQSTASLPFLHSQLCDPSVLWRWLPSCLVVIPQAWPNQHGVSLLQSCCQPWLWLVAWSVCWHQLFVALKGAHNRAAKTHQDVTLLQTVHRDSGACWLLSCIVGLHLKCSIFNCNVHLRVCSLNFYEIYFFLSSAGTVYFFDKCQPISVSGVSV